MVKIKHVCHLYLEPLFLLQHLMLKEHEFRDLADLKK